MSEDPAVGRRKAMTVSASGSRNKGDKARPRHGFEVELENLVRYHRRAGGAHVAPKHEEPAVGRSEAVKGPRGGCSASGHAGEV